LVLDQSTKVRDGTRRLFVPERDYSPAHGPCLGSGISLINSDFQVSRASASRDDLSRRNRRIVLKVLGDDSTFNHNLERILRQIGDAKVGDEVSESINMSDAPRLKIRAGLLGSSACKSNPI
jgi:hypothetical protein